MTKKARLTSIIVSVVFLLSILATGGVLLFGNTTNELKSSVFAADSYFNSEELSGTSGNYKGRAVLYIYCDGTYISSSSVVGFSVNPSSNCVYFNWSGQFLINLKAGYNFVKNSISGKFAWSGRNSSAENAQLQAYNSAVNGTSYTFNRSGNNFSLASGSIPRSSDISNNSDYAYGAGVLILDDLYKLLLYDISASTSSNASLNKTSDTYMQNSNSESTFTYTANSGYIIDTITINGVSVPIEYAVPDEFTSILGTRYKCYRIDNRVFVILTDLTQNTTIAGTAREASSWNVSSNKSSIQIQYDETYRESANATTALIVAEFSRNQNIQFTIDGNTIKLVGNNSTGTVAATGGTANYAHNIYNNFVYIEFTNLPSGAHTVVLDHYVAAQNTTAVTASMPNNSGTVTVSEDGNNKTIIAVPEANSYINSFSIDGVTVLAEYYTATVYGAGNAQSIKYYVSDSSNMFVIEIEKLYKDAPVVLNTITTTKPSYKVPPTSNGAGVTGTVVTAGSGGEVRMVGFDGDETENDTIRFVAVAYRGYSFAGWQVDGEILDGYGMSADIPYELVKDKIVTAVFEPIQNNDNTNDTTDNDQTDDLIIV